MFPPGTHWLCMVTDMLRTFFGKNNYTTFDAMTEETKVAPFCYLILYLKNDCNLYEAMDETWGECEIKGSSNKFQFNTIKEIPPILQFYIPRVGFDREKQEPFKALTRLRLFDVICMDRYMENIDMMNRRKQSWVLKKRLQEAKAKRSRLISEELGLNMTEALRAAQQYLARVASADSDKTLLEGLDGPSVIHQIEEVANDVKLELDQLETEVCDLETQLCDLFSAEGRLRYRLHAVFVHVGGATGGHWFIYIRDSKDGLWRSYNDENVTVADSVIPIVDPDPHLHGTSAFVVYVREDEQAQLVETVYRIPAPKADSPEPLHDIGASVPVSAPEPMGKVGDWDGRAAW